MLSSKRPTSAPPLAAHLEATIQGQRGPDFQSELVSIHSPLLIESFLVSCPPLAHMLKFSGFAHLASRLDCKALLAGYRRSHLRVAQRPRRSSGCASKESHPDWIASELQRSNPDAQGHAHSRACSNAAREKWSCTLKQACSQVRPRAQDAFKSLLVHGILQFTLLITLCCAFHR